MARGDRFARGRAPSEDAQGRALPSDKDMRYVALVLVCKQHPQGERPELARFWCRDRLAARGLDMLVVPTPYSKEARSPARRCGLVVALPGVRVLEVSLDPDGGRPAPGREQPSSKAAVRPAACCGRQSRNGRRGG